MVERVEVDVGEELAGLVADGDASPSFAWGEQVVAGKPVPNFFLSVTVVDDLADQPKHVLVLDLAGQQSLEDFVVHRGKEFLDVGLEDITETAGELLAAAYSGVRALALAAGVGIGNEGSLVNRLQHVDQGVVDDPIPVRSRTDLPLLRFVNEEAAVGTRSIGLGGQFLVQLPQRPFLVEVERGHGGAEAFAFAGLLGGTQQSLEGDDLIPTGCRAASCFGPALEPAADQFADFVNRLGCEAVAVHLEALQVLGEPHLEPQDFQTGGWPVPAILAVAWCTWPVSEISSRSYRFRSMRSPRTKR